MAFASDDDLSCSICCEIFKEPVVLSCTHSFCKGCLQKWWRENELHNCPLCKRTSATDPPVSLVLKTLCESFLHVRDQRASSDSEHLCNLHNEKLKLFCLDHQQPVCVVCRDSLKHSTHSFRPIDEAAQKGKQELQASLKKLKEKLKLFEGFKRTFDQATKHISVQFQHTESQITEAFKKLQKFLQDEEEARMAALKEEEKQKMEKMREKSEAASREIADLSHSIKATEEELRSGDISFLLHYKAAVERAQRRPLLDEPKLDSGAPIDVAKHLGNLSFTVWSKMKEMVSYTPVILDPNTSHHKLALSEDLTTVTHRQNQKLPDNPERFNRLVAALGSEGFDSGTHSWDVEVGDNPHWGLGVFSELSQMKGIPKSGDWRIILYQGKYTAIFCNQSIQLRLKKKPQRIRVHLDWTHGKLSFFDPDSKAKIHTFTHTFTERVFPFISSLNEQPLKILTFDISAEARLRSYSPATLPDRN
ncbi:nuclear factor 7, brain-like [Genypterus blacodes]|uniref:nuclear factor 7, brain-like n=1 Tax=Genypterus blacodes TaxID=154954 RepID=UPI003F7644EC